MSHQKTEPMTTRLIAATIVTDPATGKILLLQRGADLTFAPKVWDLPSGKGEEDEPITRTAVRELKEETGVIAEESALRLVHVVHGSWGSRAPGMYVGFVFHATQWTGTPRNAEPGKHQELRWVSPTDLPQPFMKTTMAAIRTYLTGDHLLSLEGWETRS